MMKKLFSLALILGFALSTFSQVNLCPKMDFDYDKALMAVPDLNLPILKVSKMYKPDRTYPGDFVKAIKLPEFMIGVLSDNKNFLALTDEKLYCINIETEEVRSIPHAKNGVLDTGEKFEWKTENAFYEGTIYLYKYSKETSLPLTLYKFNIKAMSVDLVWETGLTISPHEKLGKIPNTDYWSFTDKKGTAVLLDITSKKKVMEHKFPLPTEMTDRDGNRQYAQLLASYQGMKTHLCNQVNYSVSDFDTKQNYFGKYDLDSKQIVFEYYGKGSMVELASKGKSYWAVYFNGDKSTDITIYNDTELKDVRFELKSLKNSGGYNWQWTEELDLKTLTVVYTSGKKEVYDWETTKLLKSEDAAIEIKDF